MSGALRLFLRGVTVVVALVLVLAALFGYFVYRVVWRNSSNVEVESSPFTAVDMASLSHTAAVRDYSARRSWNPTDPR